MHRGALVVALVLSSIAAPLAVDAQRPEKLYRIGMLERTSTAINAANLEGFRQGLRELGYVEGKSFVIEYRSADGRDERFPSLAAELVRGAVRLAALINMSNPASPPQWKEVERATRSLGLQAQLLDVRKPEDLGPAFDGAIRQRADALVVGLETLTQANQRVIVDLA